MIAVGLTGGFASGKTTVARMFVAKGARFVSSDEIVHALLNAPGACMKRIIKVFGKVIVTDGRIDRRKLGKIIFADPIRRKTLERIIHPEVIRQIKKRVQEHQRIAKEKILIVEVPLLFEAGLEKSFDYTLAVLATRKQQVQRALQARSLTRQEVVLRIKAQLPLSVKKRLADILIDNRGSLLYTRRQVNKVWHKLSLMKKSLRG